MSGFNELCLEEALIEEIKNKKCLYDKRSTNYRNTLIKYKQWKEIGEKLGVSDEECQKKWKVLRDRDTRELKKKNLPSGSGASIHIEWELMENLRFLSDVLTSCKSRGNTEFTSSTISENTDIFTDETQDTAIKKRKCEKQDNIEKKFDSILSKCEADIMDIGVNELFSRTIAKLLDDLPVEVQEDARLYILTDLTNLKKKCVFRKRKRQFL